MVQEEILFKGISYLELCKSFCSPERTHLCNFGRGYYEEQFYDIILYLGQWFRCLLTDFLSGGLAALLFGGAEPFMQFWKKASWGTFMWTMDGWRTKTNHNSSPWAFCSGELKRKKIVDRVGPPLTKLSGSAHGTSVFKEPNGCINSTWFGLVPVEMWLFEKHAAQSFMQKCHKQVPGSS